MSTEGPPSAAPDGPAQRSEPTIRSVAAAAGVSKSLVSLVLQNSPQVSPGKRALVVAAIEALGYRPNAAARSLTQRRTRAVGLLMNDLRNPWFVEILEGLNATLGAQGLSVLLGDGRLDRAEDERLLKTFMDMRVEGLVLVGTMPESDSMREAADRLPTVVVGTRDFAFPLADVAAQDDRRGIALAVAHLLGLGHRRIAHISGTYGGVQELRTQSYLEQMTKAGLASEISVEPSDMTEDGGYLAALRLLRGASPERHGPERQGPEGQGPPGSSQDGQHRPTAIVAGNDMVGLGVLGAAHELGLRVPEDLSLVGYDNTHLAQLRHLSMTSVDISGRDVGRHAAELLLARIDDPRRPSTEYLATPTLAVRNSTGPPPDRDTPDRGAPGPGTPTSDE